MRIPVGPPNLQLYGTVGVRYFYSRTALDLSFPVSGFPPSGFAITKNWADPVAGLAAHYAINDKYFINFLADMGGLSNSATGQVLGSVGYNWTHIVFNDASATASFTPTSATTTDRSATIVISRGCTDRLPEPNTPSDPAALTSSRMRG